MTIQQSTVRISRLGCALEKSTQTKILNSTELAEALPNRTAIPIGVPKIL